MLTVLSSSRGGSILACSESVGGSPKDLERPKSGFEVASGELKCLCTLPMAYKLLVQHNMPIMAQNTNKLLKEHTTNIIFGEKRY